MIKSDVTNIPVAGVGGQGVMTATEILAEAAIWLGHDVKKTEMTGMSQRGGVVTSHLRFCDKVLSPKIAPRQADIVVGSESAEALRRAHYLRQGGLVLMNTARLEPPVVSGGLYSCPADPVVEIRAGGIEMHAFDPMAIAKRLVTCGSPTASCSGPLPTSCRPAPRCCWNPFSIGSRCASQKWSNSIAAPSQPAATTLPGLPRAES